MLSSESRKLLLDSNKGCHVNQDESFHDNTIHSIEFIDEDFETNLILNIDHITEWVQLKESCKFKVAPAQLTFRKVSDLNIQISKPGFTIGTYMETILDIVKDSLPGNRYEYTIKLLNGNFIKFNACSYDLTLNGKPRLKTEQQLTCSERETI